NQSARKTVSALARFLPSRLLAFRLRLLRLPRRSLLKKTRYKKIDDLEPLLIRQLRLFFLGRGKDRAADSREPAGDLGVLIFRVEFLLEQDPETRHRPLDIHVIE